MRTEPVVLPASGVLVLKGAIKGSQSLQYVLRPAGMGEFSMAFKPTSTSAFFNVQKDGVDKALHVGSLNGNVFKGKLDTDGAYSITVYLMRNAARRNTVANFTLRIEQRPSATPAQ